MKNRSSYTFEVIIKISIEKLENKKALKRKILTVETKFLTEELEYKVQKCFQKVEQKSNRSAIGEK